MSGKKICNAGNIYGAILPVYRLKNLSRLIKHVCGKERFEPIAGNTEILERMVLRDAYADQ